MNFDPNPKDAAHIKAQCHVLLNDIFGGENHKAYAWLRREFGKQIHFSEIDDMNELRDIFEKLWHYSFKVQADTNRKS